MFSIRQVCLSAVSAVLLLGLLVSCAVPPVWRRLESAEPFEDIWNSVVKIGRQNGYRMHPDTDAGRRTFVSRWRVDSGPFRSSKRTRMHAQMARVEPPPGWEIRFYIERQTVAEIGKSFDIVESDWSAGGQEQVKEDVIHRQLELTLRIASDPEPQQEERLPPDRVPDLRQR